jgi:hypothetical protein
MKREPVKISGWLILIGYLLPEFFDLNRGQLLTPQGWLTYFIENVTRQLDLTFTNPIDDFIGDKSDRLVFITDQIGTAGVPVCTTMDIDAVIQLKLFQPKTFLERQQNCYLEAGYLEMYLNGDDKH